MLGKYNKATKTKIALRKNYNTDSQAGNLIEFLKKIYTVCFGSNNRSLSFKPYKQVVAVKSMSNYRNNKPRDPRGFKEEVKIKYSALKVVAEIFPNGTAVKMTLLEAELIPLTLVNYCAMPPVDRLIWKKREAKN